MIKPGDVFEISTGKGEAYFQCVSKNKEMGWAIRILPGTYPVGYAGLDALIEKAINFWIFFPVAAALKAKIIRKIGSYDVPSHSKQMPLFRAGVVDPQTRKVENWWLWDGEKSWMVGEITAEQRKLPIKGIWNDTLLIQRIEEGWLPEKDLR
ncbi:hypothetical protein G6L94_00695 [Agrobacterium rhizogenes]|uniref:hypothetical protein n=1 Tax=Rhizobium rhizogenes TaxID=359 RepID=UPI00080FAAA3|nr:hypothetical protein [Rhizobium rhizogenes]OCJ22048.1 hypothetical protein A6U89_33295 [Agrobacterium sp. B133/95]NTI39781.1 hypothetical protein [Rhizobium rhizogenes]NTI46824.1 hypothetical protein [Rhizobium rhizogenes]NTI92138.1 hypothetical protein [Rhizobium rhizogenes]NTJ54663.1 hypothetical protein [Rhizobium rhizogenes]